MKVTMMAGVVVEFEDGVLEEDFDPKELFLSGKGKILNAYIRIKDAESKELLAEENITKQLRDLIGPKE